MNNKIHHLFKIYILTKIVKKIHSAGPAIPKAVGVPSPTFEKIESLEDLQIFQKNVKCKIF